jgi:hypothetical protein
MPYALLAGTMPVMKPGGLHNDPLTKRQINGMASTVVVGEDLYGRSCGQCLLEQRRNLASEILSDTGTTINPQRYEKTLNK